MLQDNNIAGLIRYAEVFILTQAWQYLVSNSRLNSSVSSEPRYKKSFSSSEEEKRTTGPESSEPYSERVLERVIWDTAVLLCHSRTSGGRRHRTWSGNQKLKGAELRLVSCLVTKRFYERKTHPFNLYRHLLCR